jgi:AraC family transcriptional regulator
MIDENVPLIIGNIVLEIHRKTLRTKETYFGFEKTVNIAEQIPAGESTGIDVPGQLWREFHAKKLQTENAIFNNDIELGVI